MTSRTVRRFVEAAAPFAAFLLFLGAYRVKYGAPVPPEALRPSEAGVLPAFVGAEACGRCHKDVHESWAKTKMAHALEVLPETAAADPACLPCHTTGYGLLDSPLPGVQCEACHGPGGRYVAAMARGADLAEIRAAGLVFPGEADCRRCHTPEWSADFRLTDRTRAGVHEIPQAAPGGAAFAAEEVGADRCRACHGPFHDPCPDRFAGACEECHGPGSRYVPVMAKGGPAEARREAGLVVPDPSVCADCHAEEGVEVRFEAAAAAAPAAPLGAEACRRCHGKRHKPCPQATDCETCHGAGSKFVPLMARRAGRPAFVSAGLRLPARGVCDECHARRGAAPPPAAAPAAAPAGPEGIGADRCVMCHDPRPHAPCPKTADCESCHGPGSAYVEVMAQGGSADERRAAGLRIPAKAEACDSCHANRSPN